MAELIPAILKFLIALGLCWLIWEITKQNPQAQATSPARRREPRPKTRKPTRKEQELIKLLYGDVDQAHRLIRQAGGSVDKAIAQLISDRSR